jgi:regulator of protease activity HflC (stomatin/prohibitin superfamily)
MSLIDALLLVGGILLILVFIFLSLAASAPRAGSDAGMAPYGVSISLPVLAIVFGVIISAGFFTLQPNEARVLILFGSYRGTVRESGFHWANPFLSKRRISLRSRNLNGGILKVNDKRGNPIEIAAVVVWRVEDTA